MAKVLKKILIVFVFVALVCLAFSFPFSNSAQAAAVEGVSGNSFVLTGLCGSEPRHLFVDDSKQSTLIKAKAKEIEGEYYSIVSDGRGTSSGWSEMSPTPDIQMFIERGLLFAQASATVQIKDGRELTVRISSGEKSESASATSGEISTPLLKVESQDQNIRFEFETESNNFVMDMPTIHLYTIIDSVTLENEDQSVSPGQFVKVNAFNDVTLLPGSSGNFLSFSKINHEIRFEFSSGEEYVKVVGTNLMIAEDAPNGQTIKFRVFSNRNSYSSEKVFSSNFVTLTVDTTSINVKVRTDFEETSPATFIGEGAYVPGKMITLSVQPNPDFEFLGWYVSGEFASSSRRLVIPAKGQDIFAKFRKSISVAGVTLPSREYDGTTDIDPNGVVVLFDGVEEKHQVELVGEELKFSYVDANVGQNKLLNATYGALSLAGKDAEIYALKSQFLPSGMFGGGITKRSATVTPEHTQKEYGDKDPDKIAFSAQNLVDGESLDGRLGRAQGEALGNYDVTIGDLAEKNRNYEISLEGFEDSFEILPRTIWLDNVLVEDKEYDGTKSATITGELKNVVGDEHVSARIEGEFVSENVDNTVEVKIQNTTLEGPDKQNYVLQAFDKKIFGTITPKKLTVIAKPCEAVYGEEFTLDFDVQGLVKDDVLSGALEIDNNFVGDHEIKVGTLANKNYVIEKFESATCKILPRQAFVYAIHAKKDFGDEDPPFMYVAKNLVAGDELFGMLVRSKGEDVGSYEIGQGDLSNPNYEIVFTGETFEITPRQIQVAITFLDKEYDGTNEVKFEAEYFNNIKDTHFDCNMTAVLLDVNCGTTKVEVQNVFATCQDAKNYEFKFLYLNDSVNILKRAINVFVDTLSKQYGESDPDFTFTTKNLVENDFLDIEIEREDGEKVGSYRYRLAKGFEEKNPNYDISLVLSSFEIVPKNVKISIGNQSKMFGDEDPEIKFDLVGSLSFDETPEMIFDGKISREQGETVGVYEYDISSLSTNANYVFENCENTSFIITKRPVVVHCVDSAKTYGDEDPIFEYSTENEVNGEKLEAQIERERGENVGEYKIYCGTLNDERYSITYVEAVFEISPCEITIKADSKVKIYGEQDPVFSAVIVSGFLRNNDSTSEIQMGSLEREEGEDVGFYEIKLGTFSFGKNYILSFESEKLEIIPRQIVVTANSMTKTYGDDDPILEFSTNEKDLVFDDKLEGALERKEGEDVGSYEILQGSLKASENYVVQFVSGTFSIEKRLIEIVPTTLSKQFGFEDPKIEYQIVGRLIGQDMLEGGLFRDGANEKENTGKYRIFSTLSNSNYEIVLDECYFTILPRKIVIKADDFEIGYGDPDPKFSYKIVDGTLLEGAEISGSLYRIKGISAGKYDIVSDLKIDKNYTIQFVKGTLTILPRKIVVQSQNYQKVYGKEDPAFDFEIVEGELINNDVLYGNIIREAGEDVGEYGLVNGLFNTNYEISLLPAQLEIIKKDVFLMTSIYDKIFDGTMVAQLKNPYISGILDDVFLEFDKDDCANFESEQVGKHIAVHVHDISIGGEKAGNYNLILPEVLFADIAYEAMSKAAVQVSAKDPVLEAGLTLNYSSEKIEQSIKIERHRLLMKYDIWLESQARQAGAKSAYTIKIDLPKDVYVRNNIYVYQKLEDGSLALVSSKKEDGELVISASSLGEFYITVEDEKWIDYASFAAICVIALLAGIFAISSIVRRKKRKNRI